MVKGIQTDVRLRENKLFTNTKVSRHGRREDCMIKNALTVSHL